LVAVRAGDDDGWLARALDALSAAPPAELGSAQVAVACLRLTLGQGEIGLLGLGEARADDEWTADDWNVVATTVACAARPLSEVVRSAALTQAAERVRESELSDVVALTLEELPNDWQRKAVIDALARRLSQGEVTKIAGPAEFLALVSDAEQRTDSRWWRESHRIAWW
jgi:hypothetical protein